MFKVASLPLHAAGELSQNDVDYFASSFSLPERAAEKRARHASKIQELKVALDAAGHRTVDQQATALGLSRSTTWTIIAGKHKASGLSASTITRILQSCETPAAVRTIMVEYVAAKAAGSYGHTKAQRRRFSSRLKRAAFADEGGVHQDSMKD